MPNFVIVEDDHLQAQPLEQHLHVAFPSATVDTLATEEEFRDALPRMRLDPPDLIVMDVMLRWSFPRPAQPEPPPDVAAGGYYRAGLRCAQLLLYDDRLASIPVVLYTILETTDLRRDNQRLPVNTTYVGKNTELAVLGRHIKSVLQERKRSKPNDVRPG